MSSATETIRAMLDERGVEWTEPNNKARSHTTYWTAGALRCIAVEFTDGMVSIASSSDDLTPEQAIEATLGRGECRNAAPSYLDFLCSECGFVHYHSDTNDTGDGNDWNFCPNCGKAVRA